MKRDWRKHFPKEARQSRQAHPQSVAKFRRPYRRVKKNWLTEISEPPLEHLHD